VDAEQSRHKVQRERPEEEMSKKVLEGITVIEMCVTFLCAQSRTEKWGEE